jgi:hypothetical protein
MVPNSLISRAAQGRGPVTKPRPRDSRMATTSWMVRPLRRASTESGVRPSCFNSASAQETVPFALVLAGGCFSTIVASFFMG